MDVAVCRKRELFNIWKQNRNEKIRRNIVTQKKDAERVVYMAMDEKAWEVIENVDSCRDGREFLEFPDKELGRREISKVGR